MELEKRVLSGLRRILLGRNDMVAEFAAAYRAELDRLRRTRGLKRDLAAEGRQPGRDPSERRRALPAQGG